MDTAHASQYTVFPKGELGLPQAPAALLGVGTGGAMERGPRLTPQARQTLLLLVDALTCGSLVLLPHTNPMT